MNTQRKQVNRKNTSQKRVIKPVHTKIHSETTALKETINTIPTPVKAICIYHWVGQGILMIIGLIFLLFTSLIMKALDYILVQSTTSAVETQAIGFVLSLLANGVGILIGSLIIITALLSVWITYQLWLGKNWARIVETVFAAFGLLSFPFGTLINGLIIYFIWFDEKTKSYFK